MAGDHDETGKNITFESTSRQPHSVMLFLCWLEWEDLWWSRLSLKTVMTLAPCCICTPDQRASNKRKCITDHKPRRQTPRPKRTSNTSQPTPLQPLTRAFALVSSDHAREAMMLQKLLNRFFCELKHSCSLSVRVLVPPQDAIWQLSQYRLDSKIFSKSSAEGIAPHDVMRCS